MLEVNLHSQFIWLFFSLSEISAGYGPVIKGTLQVLCISLHREKTTEYLCTALPLKTLHNIKLWIIQYVKSVSQELHAVASIQCLYSV